MTFFVDREIKIVDNRYSRYWQKSEDGYFIGFPEILKYRYNYIL